MRIFAALVGREIQERRQLLVAALLLGLLAYAAPWLPAAARYRYDPSEVRGGVAFVIGVFFGVGALLALASSMIARELSEGRLGFYYARPVSGVSLWLGKLTAVLLLLVTSVGLIWLPAFVDGGSPPEVLGELLPWFEELPKLSFSPPWTTEVQVRSFMWLDAGKIATGSPWLWTAVLGLILVLAVHLLALVLRLRSAWLLVDLGLLLIFALVWGGAAARLMAHDALGAFFHGIVALAAVLGLALFAAGQAQVSEGRTLARRSHQVISLVLWGLLLPFAGGAELYSRHIVGADLEDLDAISHLAPAPRGHAFLAGGPARGKSGYAPLFAVDPEGRGRRIDVVGSVYHPPAFSADGKVVAWESCPWELEELRPVFPPCEVRYLDLARPGSDPLATAISTQRHRDDESLFPDPTAVTLTLDADGRRLAVYDEGRIAVYRMPEVATVAAAQFERDLAGMPRFAGDVIRIYRRDMGRRELEVWEFDPEARELVRLAALPGHSLSPPRSPQGDGISPPRSPQGDGISPPRSPQGDGISPSRSPQGDGVRQNDELLSVWSSKGPARVYRAADLELLHEIERPTPDRGRLEDVVVLEDSGILLVERLSWRSTRLSVFETAGALRFELDIDGLAFAGSQPTADQLWLGLRHWTPHDPQAAIDEDTLDEMHIVERYEVGKTSWEGRLIDMRSGRTVLGQEGALPHWGPVAVGSRASRLLVGGRGVPFVVDAAGNRTPLVHLGGDE